MLASMADMKDYDTHIEMFYRREAMMNYWFDRWLKAEEEGDNVKAQEAFNSFVYFRNG